MQINITSSMAIVDNDLIEPRFLFLTYFSWSFDFIEFTGLSCNGAYDNFDFRLLMTNGSILGILLLWYIETVCAEAFRYEIEKAQSRNAEGSCSKSRKRNTKNG